MDTSETKCEAGGFIALLLRGAPLDGEVKVKSADAMAMARRLHREFGLLVGTSSGANVIAALVTARQFGPRATVVTLLCDRAERYFSTALFEPVDEAHAKNLFPPAQFGG